MLFKFLKKPIVLDCFTASEQVASVAPIKHAYKTYPDWWNNLYAGPQDVNHLHGNMRNCMGMTDYFKKSIHIPMWSDLHIEVQEDKRYSWKFADGWSQTEVHPKEQYGDFLNPQKSAHMKITSPWLFDCKDNIDWVWSQPIYNYPETHGIVLLPGIVNYKKINATNVNFIIDVEKPKSIFIPVTQPIISLTPMSDRKIVINRHVISAEEFSNMYLKYSSVSFNNNVRKIHKYKELNKGCPYSHYLNKAKGK